MTAFVSFGVLDVPRMIRFATELAGYDGLYQWSYVLSPLRLTLLFASLLAVPLPEAANATERLADRRLIPGGVRTTIAPED